MNLNEMAKEALEIAEKRHENGELKKPTTMNVLKHCAGEVVEAVEAFHYFWNEIPKTEDDLDLTIDDMVDKHKADLSLELADVIMCILIACAKENIDVEKALLEVMEKNRARV